MEIKFRKALRNDAKAIEQLYKSFVENPQIRVTEESVASIENDCSNLLIVGEIGNSIIATAFLVICRDVMFENQPFALVENIVVDMKFRGQGFGRKLMDYLKSESKSHKCTKVMLLSSSARQESHEFFESCGYRGDLKKGFVNYINR